MLDNGAITSDDSTIVTSLSGLSAAVVNDVYRVDNGIADPSTSIYLHPGYRYMDDEMSDVPVFVRTCTQRFIR